MRYLTILLAVLFVGSVALGQETYTKMDSVTTGTQAVGRVVTTFDLATVLSIAANDFSATPPTLKISVEDQGTSVSYVASLTSGTTTSDNGTSLTRSLMSGSERTVAERVAVLNSASSDSDVGDTAATTGLVVNRGQTYLVKATKRYIHVKALTSETSPILTIVRVQ